MLKGGDVQDVTVGNAGVEKTGPTAWLGKTGTEARHCGGGSIPNAVAWAHTKTRDTNNNTTVDNNYSSISDPRLITHYV